MVGDINHPTKHPSWGKRNNDRPNAQELELELWTQYIAEGGDLEKVPVNYAHLICRPEHSLLEPNPVIADERQIWLEYQKRNQGEKNRVTGTGLLEGINLPGKEQPNYTTRVDHDPNNISDSL